jgi:hypothetical protein
MVRMVTFPGKHSTMKATAIIPDTATVSVISDHVFCELDGEVVILQVRTGTYYGLNAVGRFVWTYIQEPRTFGQIVREVISNYDGGRLQIIEDLQKLLCGMVAAGLVQVHDGGDS